jgi:energy-coupling factor transport system ATP-binding protein
MSVREAGGTVSDPIIIMRHLSHSYQTGPLQKVALNDINLEIERGSCAAIIGVTGSGKTTLIQHMNGLLRPSSGTMLVNGINAGAQNADLRALRQRVGMLFQFPEKQLFERTVFADVAFGPKRMRLSRRDVRSRVIAAMEMVGLPHREYAHRSPFGLSGGQQRRIALAGVLAMSPDILVLDEPTVGLDAEARLEFYSYLRHVKQEQHVTIVLVSHDMTEVAQLADKLFILHEGQLVMQGAPYSIFAQPDQLRHWGLAAPPLSELLSLIQQSGVVLPETVFTLEEAYNALRTLHENVLHQ